MRILLTTLAALSLFAACAQTSKKNPVPDFKDKPVLKWKFKTSQPILSSPVMDDEIVYFGGGDSTLYALQLKDSKLVWKLKTKGPIRSTVLAHGDILYLNGGDGNLYKLDKKNGKVFW